MGNYGGIAISYSDIMEEYRLDIPTLWRIDERQYDIMPHCIYTMGNYGGISVSYSDIMEE
jgi:hypothetical protein